MKSTNSIFQSKNAGTRKNDMLQEFSLLTGNNSNPTFAKFILLDHPLRLKAYIMETDKPTSCVDLETSSHT